MIHQPLSAKVTHTGCDANDRQDARYPASRCEERQKLSLMIEQALEQHAANVAKIARRIGQIHQESDVAFFTSHRKQSFEDRRMHGDVG